MEVKKLDLKKLLVENGLGKNLVTAGKMLLNDNIKHVSVSIDNTQVLDPNVSGTIRGSLDIQLDVGDVSINLDLPNIKVEVW